MAQRTMKCLGICITLSVIALSTATILDYHPLSEERIAQINEKAKTWKAGKNFEIEDWETVKRMANGVRPDALLRRRHYSAPHDISEEIPDTFDAREQWPNCISIPTVWDQSDCGSCWAIATAAAMSDRVCIQSNQTKQTFVSAEDLNSCCVVCSDGGDGCGGGYPEEAWAYWQTHGIVTGGLYQGNQGCKDYTLAPCEHHVNYTTRPQCADLNYVTPNCSRTCSEESGLNYTESKTYGQTPIFLAEELQIQLEILKNGPVQTSFFVMDDFPNYQSGVYEATSINWIGNHAMKILGWGVENGTKYWLIANTWNTDWGLDGYIKYIRGTDHLYIESSVVAALPKA
ncbi:cathepsin B-like isoform X1 [Sitophilus oryzae]|uniref:Cathepsin B-like isoform X1 n=2 Tax=Sitophilus oryzae TaxID=7048 RepID=A0A6J2X8L3_SITOR|nr:cathepsin B-like isoform X1 [Sitophilus oryzae]